jgi:tripartite-type tricarboxylate transporter receptor subunit TctC
VPTFAELGVKGLESGIWSCIVAPPGLPKEISEKLNQAIRRAVVQPEHIARSAGAARSVWVTSGEEMQAQIRRDITLWGKVIRDAGIKIQ